MEGILSVLVLVSGLLCLGVTVWGGYYLVTGLMSWRRPLDYGWHPARSRFAVLIAARDEELLLRQLERRKIWAGALELAENRNPRFILLSALACAGFSALCVLSHPALARLPQEIYFPCLGAAFLSLGCLVYFVIRQRRGE